jgi:hypothetical protein
MVLHLKSTFTLNLFTMKRNLVYLFAAALSVSACNNSKTDNAAAANTDVKPAATDQTPVTTPATTTSMPTKIFVEGKEMDMGGSLLVQKDKDKLQPGDDYMVMLTAPGSTSDEGFVLNFLLALKTGSYPVVGMNFRRGKSPDNQMYGGLLGGKPKLTDYKVNITECKDLGSNNMGGHRWSISGEFGELVIPANQMMLMDPKKNHPKEIKIEKGSFSNLSFDDNWEELMNKAVEKMKK